MTRVSTCKCAHAPALNHRTAGALSLKNAHNGCIENMAEPFLKKTQLSKSECSCPARSPNMWFEQNDQCGWFMWEHMGTHSECFSRKKPTSFYSNWTATCRGYLDNFIKKVWRLFIFKVCCCAVSIVCDWFYIAWEQRNCFSPWKSRTVTHTGGAQTFQASFHSHVDRQTKRGSGSWNKMKIDCANLCRWHSNIL